MCVRIRTHTVRLPVGRRRYATVCVLQRTPPVYVLPRAVDTRALSGKSRAARDARVPLRHKMGTAWDVANAALFLASEEANFITGVALPVDGGALVHIN